MHDKNGRLLKVGDKVTVECVVKACYSSPEYCNISVETVEPMYPGEYKTQISLNAKQVESAEPEYDVKALE